MNIVGGILILIIFICSLIQTFADKSMVLNCKLQFRMNLYDLIQSFSTLYAPCEVRFSCVVGEGFD